MTEQEKLNAFNDWRKEIGKGLPELANRVFALRNKGYTGCGFHWTLEKDLGYIISVMNDFDNRYSNMIDQIVIKIKYQSFIYTLEKAEGESK
jgi:hypothetical protein